ncbi:MAG: alpha-D-ribose 1-methylphosphonate 5-triphosphate diphosphatase [Meiothermus sp.]|uniref:alpha-D-ribose 1-methylphosphonate 5-triphosphate diphosphatase n=1 Tax=Meiothermus sp. TaxID=1955249 RepID=UPI0025FDE6B4|nr:alpha-D-ribose 1-methylphosphonate 5-triphosphate diphosphatase [Meiothermus sp.]MCS7193370.1 alpha-D-ribose 1-methylphosphonate 5-triphosphate diphosphatase [Meiothermus sp.]MDW8091780.1 alpha-D-ribose 1-methylphosphonate 5-triphosphate diphosphatase [Meiothermus sp.]
MWLSHLRLVLPDRVVGPGALRLEAGRIAEVSPEPRADAELKLPGHLLLPGLVDLHGDSLERALEPRPGVVLPLELALPAWEAEQLAAGITTAYAALCFWEGAAGVRALEHMQKVVEALAQERSRLDLELRLHLRYELSRPGGEAAVAEALRRGWAHLLSFMDHTPGQGQFRSLEAYLRYMVQWLGRSPQEVEALLHERAQEEGLESALRLAQQARALGVPLASHDDDQPERVALMRGLGVRISEFPVRLEAARAAKGAGLWVLMGAPNLVRGGSHNGNLSAQEALEAGALDALASDYLPASMLRAVHRLYRGGWPLWRAVRLVSLHPARAAGLCDRGALAPGLRADLVLLQEETWQVRGVFVAGRPVYRRGW